MKRKDEIPPAIPAKTAAAFEFSEPDLAPATPSPPSLHPHHPHHHPNHPHHSHYTHLPSPKPLPPPVIPKTLPFPPTPPQRPPSSPNLNYGEVGSARLDTVPVPVVPVCNSSDSSDDEGIFHKFSAPSIFRRWRSGGRQAPNLTSPKSTFYEGVEECIDPPPLPPTSTSSSTSFLSSPTSPKPLAKALGKLRLNSRSVAANFKLYLSQRGGQDGEGRSNGVSGVLVECAASPPPPWRPLQKSVSSGASLTPFTLVAQDYSKYCQPLLYYLTVRLD